MTATRISRYINAPRDVVYRALLDGTAVAKWMVPIGMAIKIHAFDAHEGGAYRISLIYDAPTGAGKTTAYTDTYHGRFARLIPNERVEEVVEFETKDPTLRGEMTLTFAIEDAEGIGTVLHAVHDKLPPGLSSADNEMAWQVALAKLASLVEKE